MRKIFLVAGILASSFVGGAFAQSIGGGILQALAANGWINLAMGDSGTYTSNTGMVSVAHATNSFYVNASSVDVTGAPAGSQLMVANNTQVNVNSVSASGNVNALNGVVNVTATKPGQSADTLNFVGVGALTQASTNMGGTPGTPLGAIFGLGPAVIAYSGATNLGNVTVAEFDAKIATGASSARKSGISIAQLSGDAIQGSLYDAAVSVSKIGGTVGWKNGLLFSDYNSGFPISAGGTFIASQGSQTLGNGIDFSSATFTGAPIIVPLMTPSSSSDTCSAGAAKWDASFVYICTATNTWKRATLASF